MTIPSTILSLSCRAQTPSQSWRRGSGLHLPGCSTATGQTAWRSEFMWRLTTFAQGISNQKPWRKPANGWALADKPSANSALTFRTSSR